jgi:hypothetical protein
MPKVSRDYLLVSASLLALLYFGLHTDFIVALIVGPIVSYGIFNGKIFDKEVQNVE